MSIHEQDRLDQEYIDAMECAIHWQNAARKDFSRMKNVFSAIQATDEYHAIAERQGVPMKTRIVCTSQEFLASLEEEENCEECRPADKLPAEWNFCILCGRDLRENTQ